MRVGVKDFVFGNIGSVPLGNPVNGAIMRTFRKAFILSISDKPCVSPVGCWGKSHLIAFRHANAQSHFLIVESGCAGACLMRICLCLFSHKR